MWTPFPSAARLIEGWYNRILQRMIPVASLDDVDPATFCKHRNKVVTMERQRAGLDVKKDWALCLARWMEHVQRHPESPACLILSVQDDLWLETMRALHTAEGSDSALRAGRTGTRSGRGRPIRWSAGWVTAVQDTFGWANSLRDKGLTRERASVIEAILSFGTWHGIRAVDL